jgi:adenylosuccinate synthase
MSINYVDVCCGLAWGDEAKGKIIAQLSKSKIYDFVCRWAGGNNAGHTIYINKKKYKTHLIPSGIFYGIPSIIGPACVVNPKAFLEEIDYLHNNGFDTNLIKLSPKAQVVQEKHIDDDRQHLLKTQGTTAKGIAPCYSDKYKRIGTTVESIPELRKYLWDEKLNGNILCEGAQGFWLDIDQGNYPYVTSSTTLPYGACSLGFPPQKFRKIYGAAKIYDTRSGIDPLFPDTLFEDTELLKVIDEGKEYGTTTGRKRKVQWLDLSKLIKAINISGITDLIISKVDVLITLKFFKLYYSDKLIQFNNIDEMKEFICKTIHNNCSMIENITFSASPYNI